MPNISRRKALQVASGTASTIPMMGLSLAQENQAKDFIGVSYSPLTQKAQSKVSARLKFHENAITGRLKVGGFTIPLKRDGEPVKASRREGNRRATFHLVRSEERFTVEERVARENGNGHRTEIRNLNIKLELKGEYVVGYLSRRGNFGKLAYTMWPTARHDGGDVRTLLVNDGQGYADAPPQKMPEEGLPARPPLGAFGGGGDE